MNILVIGNGFDIAHDLPTEYGHFLKFVQAFQEFKKSTENEESNYYQYFLSLKENKVDIYNEINTLVEDNLLLNYFIKIYKRKQSDDKNGWIDFESEISAIIQALDAARLTLNEQFKQGEILAQIEQWQLNILHPVFFPNQKFPDKRNISFDNTAVGLKKNRALNDLNKLIRCLEIYLSDYISIEKCKKLKDVALLQIDKVLSFNYTDTYKILYHNSGSSKADYDFIHGKAEIGHNIENCNLVLGIDEYLTEDLMNKDNEFIQFKKFYQRIYKGTGCHYIDWINERSENAKKIPKLPISELNIYIYGHSLDVTDADILKRLILAEGAKTTIFYHNKKAMGNQIANLVKVIGEEELIKRTDGRNRTIIFQQSSNEKV